MKKIIVLTVLAIASQAVAVFAGEPMVSSKEVVAPPPPPPPPEFFRPNEFDIGAFGTYATGVGSGENAGKLHAWGGGMDFTYWFPWKYAGVRFQGAGVSIRGGGGSRTVTVFPGFTEPVTVTGGGGSVAAGILTGDFLLRLPLDDFWPSVHLAPYIFGGFGGVFTGAGGNTINTSSSEVNERFNNASSNVSNNRFLGNTGGGLEYRFTPHIAVFGEAGYNFVGGGNHNFNSSLKNFIQTNFGLRFAF